MMERKRMRIGFLLGSPDINGGTYVIYEHGSHLKERGHEVFMLTREAVTPDRYQWHPKAKTLRWMTMEEAEQTEFDIVFATYWQSPFLLPQLTARYYAYFVQSIESRFFEEPDPSHHNNRDLAIWKAYCESTYALNVPVITEAEWIRSYLYENYNRESYLVRNGIRKDIYRTDGPAIAGREPGKLRVLVEGPVDVFYKNVPKSVELCRQAGVDELWLLTSSDIDSFAGVDRVFSRVPIHDTPAIYRSCDVLVKLSYVEGMFGPPLEIFHCGGTAIVYDVTGHDEYIVHDHNSLVVARDDDQQVVECLRALKEDRSLLQRLQEGALETAAGWPDWREAAAQFEAALLDICAGSPTSRTYVRKWVERRNNEKKEQYHLKEIVKFAAREEATGTDGYDRHNFIQVYHKIDREKIDPEQVQWFHYNSDEDTTVTANMTISGFPFWIRVDPSVRFGVIIIDRIRVTNVNSNLSVMELKNSKDFDSVYLGGTIKKVGRRDKAVFVSFGIDPWFYLPQITEGAVGDELEVSISLKEIGMTQYANRHNMQESRKQGGRQGGRLNRLKRFLRK